MIKLKWLGWKDRLGAQLAAAVLASLALAACVAVAGGWGAYALIGSHFQSRQVMEGLEERCLARLQDFITSKDLGPGSLGQLDQWVAKEKYVALTIFRKNRVLYDSALAIGRDGGGEILDQPSQVTDYADYPDSFGMEHARPVQLSDGPAQAWVAVFYEYKYDNWALAGACLLGLGVFVAVFLRLVRKKTWYIQRMKEELEILEGGDLGFQVTVEGRDELAELAQGINSMRQSILDREEDERQARRANQELVTAMSHDLRTPLTSLLGYLELLEGEACQDERQLRHFIQGSHKKALQIKEMSDRLFEYFLVYGRDSQEALALEEVDARSLLDQILYEHVFDLETKGFAVKLDMGEIRCSLMVDVDLFRRVFDNLFSNLIKYAHPGCPVFIRCQEEGQEVVAFLHNEKDRSKGLVESSGIGLKTCKRILEDHGGWFQAQDGPDEFVASLGLPAKEKGEQETVVPSHLKNLKKT